MTNKNKVTAIIPVRKGSRRLVNKNIFPFLDSSLLKYKINQLKKVELVERIVVSTDSEEMIEIAKEENVDYQIRPVEYCDEKSKTFNEVVEYISLNIEAQNLMWAPCVCPAVKVETYRKAIETFLNLKNENDSVVSAKLLKEYVFDETSPLNFSIENHVPSQKLPNWHIITNGFFIAKREDMAKWKFVYGKKPFLFEVSKFEALDIDDEYDFKLAEYVCKNFRRDDV